VRPEPKGTVLVVGPWNYPFQLLFSPLAGALAAGNAVCIKPSEFAPATAREVETLCQSAFPDGWVTVVQGDHRVSTALVQLPFDHIFFTGSTATGRLVAKSAAGNLVSTTLELGGKSPCVVCADAPLAVSARRVVWGKCLNAGQTCVAPDHVWVHESVEQAFLGELRTAARAMVPTRPPAAQTGDYGRIVNARHFDRLEGLLEGARLFDGGERDRDSLVFAPAILTEVGEGHPAMREEIFGPLLPVLPFRSLEALVRKLNARPRPLAAYVFTRDRDRARMFRERVVAGGICVNDTVSHIIPPDLPFGGLGESGIGRYRGRAGFACFSHEKPILARGFFPDLPFRYPPYTISVDLLKRAYRWLSR
jgi:aldehyde dehydrogenase (NAD+)